MPNLEDLLFVGNPLYDNCELEVWRQEVAKRLPNLKKLDGETVVRDDGPVSVGQAPNQVNILHIKIIHNVFFIMVHIEILYIVNLSSIINVNRAIKKIKCKLWWGMKMENKKNINLHCYNLKLYYINIISMQIINNIKQTIIFYN